MIPKEEAAKLLCPFARTFAEAKAQPYCRTDACAIWRHETIASDHPLLKAAIGDKMREIGKGPGGHKDAVAFVMENRDALGIPRVTGRGQCGGMA